jgi:hypothetical protein
MRLLKFHRRNDIHCSEKSSMIDFNPFPMGAGTIGAKATCPRVNPESTVRASISQAGALGVSSLQQRCYKTLEDRGGWRWCVSADLG